MPDKPRLLDLFCGPGAIARGYATAGFDVVGVDLHDQPRYPFEFHRADALEFLFEDMDKCWPYVAHDAIHASPPCPFHSSLTGWGRHRKVKTAEVDLIPPLRQLLIETGLPYVIESPVTTPARP